VPEDLAIVGFDDVEAAGLVRPGLTTVAQDREALARAAVGALRDLIDQPRAAARPAGGSGGAEAPEPASVTLPPPRIVATKLLVRASCGGPT
jgi:LacI family transcriptional regulator